MKKSFIALLVLPCILHAQTVKIKIDAERIIGKAEVNIITSNDLQQPFEFDKQEQYKPVTTSVDVKNNKLSYSFPPHSFTQIKVNVGGK